MTRIQELDKKIEELQKEKQIAELELEIKKIKKTVIEETIIKRVVKEEPWCPLSPFPAAPWYTDSTPGTNINPNIVYC